MAAYRRVALLVLLGQAAAVEVATDAAGVAHGLHHGSAWGVKSVERRLHDAQHQHHHEHQHQHHHHAAGAASVMRRHEQHHASVVGARGELHVHHEAARRSRSVDYCRNAYKASTAADNSGKNASCPAPYRLVVDRDECADASRWFGYTNENQTVVEITWNQTDLHPWKCFKKGEALFFNGAGQASNGTVDGVPICVADRYFVGTAATNKCDDSSNQGYANIVVEDDCRSFAQCYAEKEDPAFQVVGAESQAQHPKGCYVHENVTHFNNLGEGATQNEDGTLVGQPVCSISKEHAATAL